MVKHRVWHTLSEPKHGKPIRITVWRNKDFETPGQLLRLESAYLRSWTAILDRLTQLLTPKFGAVRKLYNMETSTQVFCLSDIRTDGRYLAAGSEAGKFMKNGYLTENELKQQKRLQQKVDKFSQLPLDGLDNFLSYTEKHNRTVLFVMVSGRENQPPSKVVLMGSDLLEYEMVLQYLSYALDVVVGVRYLCTVRGRIIGHFSQVVHGCLYIAVPYGGEFIELDYKKIAREKYDLPVIGSRLRSRLKSIPGCVSMKSVLQSDKTTTDTNKSQHEEMMEISKQLAYSCNFIKTKIGTFAPKKSSGNIVIAQRGSKPVVHYSENAANSIISRSNKNMTTFAELAKKAQATSQKVTKQTYNDSGLSMCFSGEDSQRQSAVKIRWDIKQLEFPEEKSAVEIEDNCFGGNLPVESGTTAITAQENLERSSISLQRVDQRSRIVEILPTIPEQNSLIEVDDNNSSRESDKIEIPEMENLEKKSPDPEVIPPLVDGTGDTVQKNGTIDEIDKAVE